MQVALVRQLDSGFATLSAIYLALKQYKENNPWITHVAVKTDGAGAYAGIVFTVSTEPNSVTQ